MRGSLLFVAAFVLALSSAAAQQAPPAPAPPFSAERFHAHMQFLADDLLEGREMGSRGHEVGARYVASQFASAGLSPAGENGTWFQQVKFQKTELTERPPSLSISGPAGESHWPHGGSVMIRMNALDPALDVTAPLVFVGYGVENELLKVNDYRGLDVNGKIAVALRGFPKGLPSEEGAHLTATKLKAAERHGAVGLLQVDTLQSMKTTPWASWLSTALDPDYYWIDSDDRPFLETPRIKARAALNGAAAEALFAGAARSLAVIRKEADRSGAMPRGFALKTSLHMLSPSRSHRITSPNVIAMVRGSDPVLSSEVVVLSAHLDHLGVVPEGGEAKNGDRIYNGALDNAAGVATLLEVARAMAAAPVPPRRTVVFLASTGEEQGLLGADYYARHPTAPGRMVGNVDLDMPLLLYRFTDVVAFGANHSTFGKLVSDALAPMNVKLSPDPLPEQGFFTRSDHYMFVKQGVPAVFLMTGYANGGEKAWDAFMANAYHQVNDDLKQPIDWASGARFAEANYRITRAMADDDAPPLWLDKDFFGDTFAPKAARAPK